MGVWAGADAKVTLTSAGTTTTVDLYSAAGVELVSQLWIKLYTEFRLTHTLTWQGIPIIQLPEDICMLQEVVWQLKPDVIIECGVAHGGSLVFYAGLLELLGHGRVLGVDVEIRPPNRIAIEGHSLAKRIDLIEGSSVADATVAEVTARVQGAHTVMVVLDSNHSKAHVARELEIYSELVTPGSYLVAMDGAQAWVSDIPRGKPQWRDDNPLAALHEFLARDPRYVADDHFNRLKVTASPLGFLRRIEVSGARDSAKKQEVENA